MPCLKWIVRILVCPLLFLLLMMYRLRICSFSLGGEFFAVLPGDVGLWIRRKWYEATLQTCGQNLHVDWMAVIKNGDTKIGNDVWIGPFSWVCWTDIGDNVMLGGHVKILSGGRQHGYDRLDVPIREQEGEPTCVRIGCDVWIGNSSIVIADISDGTVVGAASMVDRVYDPGMVIAGVPARQIARRGNKDIVYCN